MATKSASARKPDRDGGSAPAETTIGQYLIDRLHALGVNHICSALPSRAFDDAWSVEGLTRLRRRVESFGIRLDMVPLPLSSSPVGRAENPDIMLGRSPQRDRQKAQVAEVLTGLRSLYGQKIQPRPDGGLSRKDF